MMLALRRAISEAIYKKETPKPSSQMLSDIAWSEPSVMYSAKDFEKYNPDSLIGIKGASIYKRMMLDEQIKAVTKFKRDAMTSRDYTFELDHKLYGLTEEEADRRIKISYATIEEIKGSWQDVLNGIMSAMQNGFSMSEKIFKQFQYNGLTYWGVDKIKVKPFDTFRFNVDEFSNTTSVTQKLSGKEQNVDIDKFIHFLFNPDIDEHYGQSELRECYRAWFSKDLIYKFRNIWLEKHAGGHHWAKILEGVVQPGTVAYTELQNLLTNIQSSTGAIIPKNVELKGEFPSNNVAFKEAIEDQDTAIARGLLVPNLLGVSPQGDVGSYSQSTSQLEAFFWTLEADTKRLEDALNEQLFRQLGQFNFSDGVYPKYKFKPVSKSKMYELVNTWKDLVDSGAVTHSINDESYIRELLDMPSGVEDEEKDKTATRPDTALNGAQVSSMVEVVTNVSTGMLTKDAAMQILVAAFPLSLEQASAIVKDIEIKKQEPIDNQPDTNNSDTNNSDTNNSENENDNNSELAKNEYKEETIIGAGSVTISAFDRAIKRVDFAVIDKQSESSIDSHLKTVSNIMDSIVDDLVTKGESGGDLNKDINKNISAIKVNSKLKTKLNKAFSNVLRDGHKIGIKHARAEIIRADKNKFDANKFNMKHIDFIAEDFFKTVSFKMAGNLADDAAKVVENVILNGARYDWGWDKTKQEIYAALSAKGMISEETAQAVIGSTNSNQSADALLHTFIRTGTFEAINEARYEFFTDPEMDNFVTAFEYSAILDQRTTAICEHLEDGHGDHSVEWYDLNSQYKPPNHYNCRSLLIPITQLDKDFVEGPEPTQTPQVGFGGRM